MKFFKKGLMKKCEFSFAEVTERAIEETAAVVLRLYDERQSNRAMPRISKCY